jgi:hypothetical protein
LEEKRGEIDLTGGRQGLQIPPIEPRHLPVLRDPRPLDQRIEGLGVEQPLLGPEDEVGDLPGETRDSQKVAEPGPVVGLLAGEKLPDDRILLRGGKDLRRLVVAQLAEMTAESPEGEPMDGGNGEVRERSLQTPDEVIPSLPRRSTVQREQGHALRINPRLHEPSEALAQQGRLPRARRARHEEDPALVIEDAGLLPVGLHAHAPMLAARSDTENGRLADPHPGADRSTPG